MKITLRISIPDCPVEIREFRDLQKILIGRGETCDLSFPLLHAISREHAALEFVDGRWILTDLNSKFGTLLQDTPLIKPTEIDSGQQFRLGTQVKITCEIAESPPSSTGELTGQRQKLSTGPSQTKPWLWHLAFGSASLLLVIGTAIGHQWYTSTYPPRGYTSWGICLGILGSLLLCLVAFYAGRKRTFQEVLPWRLVTWLRLHFWWSLVAIWFIALHSGFHMDGGSGTFSLIMLGATLITGLGGWYLYRYVPGRVYSSVGNLATDAVRSNLDSVERRIGDLVAGRGNHIYELANRILATKSDVDLRNLAGAETGNSSIDVASDLFELGRERVELIQRQRRQESLRWQMRGWLWLHIPIALFFLATVVVHVYDAAELKWYFVEAGPPDYADPMSCAECHRDQYDEWIGSMHAIAQLSPVTDLQNRLVVLKDRFDEGREGIVVGDLCVKCHAPTSRLGRESDREDEILAMEDRHPAGQFGVSCVACHQISSIHPSNPFPEDPDRVRYKNAENLSYTQGRKMFGPFGDRQPSVGNRAHRGDFAPHFGDPSFCASCHTVMVDPTGPDNLVALQNTYQEWLDGGNKTIDVNWSKQGISCLDCHGKPLDALADHAQQMQRGRLPLEDRVRSFVELVRENAAAKLNKSQLAATPQDGFDQILRPRRNHLHTFVGVDYHLEADLPYLPGHPLHRNNAAIQANTTSLVEQLLQVASAIKIENIVGDAVVVQVANLATGHHLPAGFAFAREMWIEVSVSPDTEANYLVVAGGHKGRPLQPQEPLDKFAEGKAGKLKNFQAVLWNGDFGEDSNGQRTGETVLQNECVKVLKGKDAVDQGFFDREQFLKPGEIRTIRLEIGAKKLAQARRVRVRLRFRNYPPEFLDQLADRFEAKQDKYLPPRNRSVTLDREMWAPDPQRAERTRNLIRGLKIFEMAQDELTRSQQQLRRGEW